MLKKKGYEGYFNQISISLWGPTRNIFTDAIADRNIQLLVMFHIAVKPVPVDLDGGGAQLAEGCWR